MNRFEADERRQERTNGTPAHDPLFTPLGTAFSTGLWCVVWFMFAAGLNKLHPWASEIIPEVLLVDRNAGLFLYALKSIITAVVVSAIIYTTHHTIVAFFPVVSRYELSMGITMLLTASTSFIAVRLLVR